MKKILVITHDAGGAQVIAAYIKKYRHRYAWRIYSAGPSRTVFKQWGLTSTPVGTSSAAVRKTVRANRDAAFALLPLPGWMTSVERTALTAAKHHHLRTVVYLDSWLSYKKRFGYPRRGWQHSLPDEVWAGDSYAARLAKKELSIPVRQVPNEYFVALKRKFQSIARRSHASSDTILFLSTPGIASRDVLEELLARLSPKRTMRVRIRLHPADTRGRYRELIRKYPLVAVTVSATPDLMRDIARARLVIGTETVAMVAAVLAGKKTISITPPGQKHYVPFKQIIRARRVGNLVDSESPVQRH